MATVWIVCLLLLLARAPVQTNAEEYFTFHVSGSDGVIVCMDHMNTECHQIEVSRIEQIFRVNILHNYRSTALDIAWFAIDSKQRTMCLVVLNTTNSWVLGPTFLSEATKLPDESRFDNFKHGQAFCPFVTLTELNKPDKPVYSLTVKDPSTPRESRHSVEEQQVTESTDHDDTDEEQQFTESTDHDDTDGEQQFTESTDHDVTDEEQQVMQSTDHDDTDEEAVPPTPKGGGVMQLSVAAVVVVAVMVSALIYFKSQAAAPPMPPPLRDGGLQMRTWSEMKRWEPAPMNWPPTEIGDAAAGDEQAEEGFVGDGGGGGGTAVGTGRQTPGLVAHTPGPAHGHAVQDRPPGVPHLSAALPASRCAADVALLEEAFPEHVGAHAVQPGEGELEEDGFGWGWEDL